jgi:ligand-binding SRPBCC domain-containing protein
MCDTSNWRLKHSADAAVLNVSYAMHVYTLEREQRLPRPIGEIFEFFSHPANLQSLTPAWLDFRILNPPEKLHRGSLIHYELRWRKIIPLRWTTEIAEWNPPYEFVDRQISGPYALWNHEHSFSVDGDHTLMRDRVDYALPLGWIGGLAHRVWVKDDVEKIFDFRAQAMLRLFPQAR